MKEGGKRGDQGLPSVRRSASARSRLAGELGPAGMVDGIVALGDVAGDAKRVEPIETDELAEDPVRGERRPASRNAAPSRAGRAATPGGRVSSCRTSPSRPLRLAEPAQPMQQQA